MQTVHHVCRDTGIELVTILRITLNDQRGLPTTQQGLRYSLKKSAGNSPELVRKRAGSKAFEYHIDCLPEQAREIVKARHYREVLKQSDCSPAPAAPKREVTTTRDELALLRQCPVLLEREVSDLTERQKQIADARALLAAEVERLRDIGMSRASAVEFIAKESRKGSLPENIQAAADIANARKGSSRRGVGERTLQEWLSVYLSTRPGIERLALLAPGHLKARKPEQIKWLPDFLAHWRKLSGPSLVDAWRSFKTEWQAIYAGQPAMLAVCPSYDAVRRAMEKLPKRERARGRISGSAALAFEVYQKRDWSQMPVNGCWIADGKSLDMKVAHPVHGRPFTPELTLVIDGRTRFLVGWSLALSENVIAVADAYRYAMKFHGKPLFVYSDNGLTPFEIGPGDTVQIVRAISTYTKNAEGVDDVSLLDITTIRTLDYVRKACRERISLRFPRDKLSSRTPPKVQSELLDVLIKLEELEIIEEVEANKSRDAN